MTRVSKSNDSSIHYLEVAASSRQQLSFALEGLLNVTDDDADVTATHVFRFGQSQALEPVGDRVGVFVASFAHD